MEGIGLKPCPFCGSSSVVLFATGGGVCVKCLGCRCQTEYDTDACVADAKRTTAVERVVASWNRRIAHDEEAIMEKCMDHYRQGREDEAALREGRLMQSFNPD